MTDQRITQIHELIETMIDAAQYIQDQINNGDLSMAIIVTEDLIAGFVSIEQTFIAMAADLVEYDKVDRQLALIKESLNKIVLSFESNEPQQVASIINRSLTKQLRELLAILETISVS